MERKQNFIFTLHIISLFIISTDQNTYRNSKPKGDEDEIFNLTPLESSHTFHNYLTTFNSFLFKSKPISGLETIQLQNYINFPQQYNLTLRMKLLLLLPDAAPVLISNLALQDLVIYATILLLLFLFSPWFVFQLSISKRILSYAQAGRLLAVRNIYKETVWTRRQSCPFDDGNGFAKIHKLHPPIRFRAFAQGK